MATYSLKKDKNKKLSKDFKVSDFRCKDGSDKVLVDEKLVQVLQYISDQSKSKVTIISGYRSPSYNAKLSGAAKNSLHMQGKAADIVVKNFTNKKVCGFAEDGLATYEIPGGIGLYDSYDKFVHVDVRTSKWRWLTTKSGTHGGLKGWQTGKVPEPISDGIIVKTGKFKLFLDKDKTTTFQDKFNIKINPDTVPYIAIPNKSKPISGSKNNARGLVGYCAMITNDNNQRSAFAFIGDLVPAVNGWGYVSKKLAQDLGLSDKKINNPNGMQGKYTIKVWIDRIPDWKQDITELNTQIQKQGTKRNGGEPSKTSVSYNNIDVEDLTPYVATIHRDTKMDNFSILKKNDIVGVVIEAGQLYTASFTQQYFRNPNLEKQVNAAIKANLPWGLYATVRARTEQEANAEMDELAFCVRQYPPVLGVWLQLRLTKSVKTNDRIIGIYYERLWKLGLKDRVGFYVNQKQLNQITWTKYQDDWYLWLVNHIKNLNELDDLSSEFFSI